MGRYGGHAYRVIETPHGTRRDEPQIVIVKRDGRRQVVPRAAGKDGSFAGRQEAAT